MKYPHTSHVEGDRFLNSQLRELVQTWLPQPLFLNLQVSVKYTLFLTKLIDNLF